MRNVWALLFVFGCGPGYSGPADASDGAGGATSAPTEECSLPNVGSAPRSCVVSDDCFWSQCSMSSCIKGACVHMKRADGAVCLAPELGTAGTCDECLCTIET